MNAVSGGGWGNIKKFIVRKIKKEHILYLFVYYAYIKVTLKKIMTHFSLLNLWMGRKDLEYLIIWSKQKTLHKIQMYVLEHAYES